jgi:hypothetical protein
MKKPRPWPGFFHGGGSGLDCTHEIGNHVSAIRLEQFRRPRSHLSVHHSGSGHIHADVLIDLAQCILGKSRQNANPDLHGVATQGSKQLAVH